ncbi:unnamed protein product, partial [Effrenium voratum]
DVHGFVQKTRERLVEQVQAERAALRARQAKAAAAAAGADLDAFRQQCEARLAQRLLAGMPQVKTGLVEAEGGTGFFRRKICIVGAGPVGLWAAMLLAQKYRWTDPSGCARLRPDAPQLVLLEARSAESHCSRTDIRIALSSSTRAMLDQQTRSRSFSSGMPVAEIEEAFLRRWRKLAGSEAKILYDTSVQDLGALEDCDCVFWAAGRRSLEDASRKALGCEVKVGDSQKVIVFQISELGPDTNAWQLASLDLSGIAQQASRSLCNLRVMLRPGFEGACACWPGHQATQGKKGPFARRLHSISERNASQRRFGWGGTGHDCVCGCARGRGHKPDEQFRRVVSDASGGAEQGMTASAEARAGEGTSPSSSGALAGSLEREGKRRRLSCNKALVLLVSSKRTEQQEAASGLRLVTKDIIDGLAEADAAAAEKFTAIAYCTVHNLKDFVLDPPRTGKKLQYALAIACSKSATEGQAKLIVEQLQLLREADVDVATKCMRQLLLMSSVTATRGPPPGTHAPWTESTAPALQQALCPALSAYPRGEPWANALTAPGVHACSD